MVDYFVVDNNFVALIEYLVVGIISSLIMGSGMSLIMIANDFTLGLIVGIIGLIGMIITYPIYRWIFNFIKKEISSEVIELCDKELK